jgi:hypothetical protein
MKNFKKINPYEVVVYFADIGGVVDHHCSNFPFIN